jgi:hypothetical protein
MTAVTHATRLPSPRDRSVRPELPRLLADDLPSSPRLAARLDMPHPFYLLASCISSLSFCVLPVVRRPGGPSNRGRATTVAWRVAMGAYGS